MKTFTIDNIMDLGPCREYSHERVTALFAGREALTLARVLDLDIPAEDRIWAVTRLLPAREARLFAADCAERVLPLFERAYPGDDRPRKAIEVARRYARGEATEKELGEARKAADAAYWAADAASAAADAASAAADAASAAAGAAYWSAADAGAYDAAYWAASAAGAAAGNAADAAGAAGAAEREWQVERLKVYAKELETV